jgi:CTP:molybdopterin cytidylyltransferase MocA/NCAIR mutase (PurE)-related protein
LDLGRAGRLGFGEAILCAQKTPAQIDAILRIARDKGAELLLTRLSGETLAALSPEYRRGLDYHAPSRTAFFDFQPKPISPPRVAVVTAGTSDAGPAWEAMRTLAFQGVGATAIFDVGVAGIWRLMDRVDDIARHPVVIAVAGMDAALPSVLGGLVPGVLIAVPTSTGYGVAREGETALFSCLTSCAPGVTVCNIDNGYGAACAALRALGALGLEAAEPERAEPRVAAIVLAAGASGRMGERNKLLCEIHDKAIVRHAVETLLAGGMDDVVVVTGHEAPSVAAAVAGLSLRLVHNDDHAAGMGTSLARGITALPEGIDGALISLGDMPHVRPDTVRRIVAAFRPSEGADIRVPVHRGRRGHPVLFGRRLFGELRALTGDTGARALMETFQAHVVEVPVDDGGILKDYDTPEDFRGGAAAGPKAVTG